MGFFRKKNDDPEQLDALRSEIVALRERLDTSDREKAELREKVDTVDQVNAALYQRVDTVDQTNAVLYQRVDALDSNSAHLGQQVGAIGSSTNDLANQVGAIGASTNDLATRVGALGADTNDLATRVGAVDAEVVRVRDGVSVISEQVGSVASDVGLAGQQASIVSTLGTQLQALAHRVNTPPLPPPDKRVEDLVQQVTDLSASISARVDGPAVDTAEVRAITARLDEISQSLASQSDRLDEAEHRASTHDAEQAGAPPAVDADDVAAMRREMSQMAERMATLDHRMTNVSTELANQLTELSNDLEVLLEATNDPDAGGTTDDSAAVALAIEAVQTSTERLAAEQARYQIAFREDLAELAERLRRPTR